MSVLMKRITALLLLIVSLAMTGCKEVKELDDMSYVLTIGIDKSEEPGKYIFSYRIAMPKVFTGDGGGDDKEKTKVVSVKSVSLSESLKELSMAMNRQIEVSHASAVFIHEPVARQGIYPLLSVMLHSPIYRNSIVLLVTKQEARSVLEKNTAPFELFQYRWIDSLMRIQDFAASYNLGDIRNFNAHMKTPMQASLAGLGGINEDTLERYAAPPLAKHAVPQYMPGTMPRNGGSELLVAGSAIFKDWRMVGALTSSEAMGAIMLVREVNTVMTISDPVKPDFNISVNVRTLKPDITVKLVDGKMKLDIAMQARCQVDDNASGVNYLQSKNQQELERQLAEALQGNIYAYLASTKPLGADCVRLADYYRPRCSSYDKWAAYDWPELYKTAEADVNVKVEVKRIGLLGRSAEEGESL